MWNKLIDFLKGSSSKYEELFKKSIEMAREAGVPEDQILKSVAEIDSYFLEKNTNKNRRGLSPTGPPLFFLRRFYKAFSGNIKQAN